MTNLFLLVSLALNGLFIAVILLLGSKAMTRRNKRSSYREIPPQGNVLQPNGANPDVSPHPMPPHYHMVSHIGVHQRRQSLFSVLPQNSERVVFLGDSMVQTCEWSELLSPHIVQNRGIAGDTTAMVVSRMATIVALNPVFILLMLGINDLRQERCQMSQVLETYDEILATVHHRLPEATVVVHGVLPVHPRLFQEKLKRRSGHINPKVASFNPKLQSLCQRYGHTYLDLSSILTDSTGQLNASYTVDGMHLSGNGYLEWAKVLKPLLVSRVQDGMNRGN